MNLKLEGDFIEALGLHSNVTVLKSQSERKSLDILMSNRIPMKLIIYIIFFYKVDVGINCD